MQRDPAQGWEELAEAFDELRDEASFRALYRRLTPGLYRVALGWLGGRSVAAEDVVQEAWLRALRGSNRFRGRASLKTWLTGILLRCCWEAARRDARRREEPLDAAPLSPRSPDVVLRIDLLRDLGSLSQGYRAVLLLHDVEGFTHAEIGELLGISEGTSKSQLSRARRALRMRLGGAPGREPDSEGSEQPEVPR